MQYITPAGETGKKVGETPDEFQTKRYQLELPSGPGEAPRFEWFKPDELVPVDDTTGLPGPVPQEPVKEMDLEAQLQNENALQAMEIIELKSENADLKAKLQVCEQTIASLNGQLDLAKAEVDRLKSVEADYLARTNSHIMNMAQLKHDLKAFTDVYGPKVPAAPTPSDNANNAG